tara:strand:- start:811 stop:1020 length:210 start_codon:yes stop_codon:yes gene_type:complete
MTLGELIKEKGYTQKHVHKKLDEKGINMEYTHFNRWCKDVYKPRNRITYRFLSEIIGESEELIRNCFKD